MSAMSSHVEWHSGTSRQARQLARFFRIAARPVAAAWPFTPVGLRGRSLIDQVGRRFVGPLPRWAEVTPVPFPQFTAEWVRVAGRPETQRVVLFTHGGGFVLGSPLVYRSLTARIARAVDADVLAVDYRFAPRERVQTAAADCLSAYRWLLQHGWQPEQIVVCGDSAGGNLAFATVLGIIALGLPVPAGLIAISPFLDLSLSGASLRSNWRVDPFMSVRFIRHCAGVCVADDDGTDPRLSPVFADVTGLPPTLIQVGSTEVLYSDSERMAERLVEAGVPCRLQVWERQVHDFPVYGVLPEARAAIDQIARFIREVAPADEGEPGKTAARPA